MAGSRLFFIDLLQEGSVIQGLCNFSRLTKSEVSIERFRHHCRMLQRGDVLSRASDQYYPSIPQINLSVRFERIPPQN